MSQHDDGHEQGHHHHHACANLFGCGDEKGIGIIREDIKDAAFDDRASDRILHMDEVDQETFDGYLSDNGRGRRKFLQASSFMGVLAAVEPWFARLARAERGPRRGANPMAKAACTWFPRQGRQCGSACSMPTCHPFSPSIGRRHQLS